MTQRPGDIPPIDDPRPQRTDSPYRSDGSDVQASGSVGSNRASNYGGHNDPDQPAEIAELQGYFGGIDFPVDKQELVRQVDELAGSPLVMDLLAQLPEHTFRNPQEVNRALGVL